MKKIVLVFVLLLVFTYQAQAGTITYTLSTNTWDYTGFLKTNIGNYTNTGVGILGGDGGTIIGGGTHFLWNNNDGGGAGTYDFSTYTDYYWPGGYQVEVIGATWTNTEVRYNNQGEGIFGYQHLDGTTLVGTSIADGTILNGVFTYDNTGRNSTWSYEGNTNPVPVPTTMVLLGFGLLGLAGVSRRK